MKVLERFDRKNPTATASNIKEQVPEVAAVSVKQITHLILKNKYTNLTSLNICKTLKRTLSSVTSYDRIEPSEILAG